MIKYLPKKIQYILGFIVGRIQVMMVVKYAEYRITNRII